MPSFVERRQPISGMAISLAVIFWAGAVVAIVSGGAPTWQNHGPDAGPGFVQRSTNPELYYWMSGFYVAAASISTFFAVFRFPWVTIAHIRLLFLLVFLLMLGSMIYFTIASQ
jgi:hypothetical protein